jgi:hypothetical protein
MRLTMPMLAAGDRDLAAPVLPHPVGVPGPRPQANFFGTSGDDDFTGTANADVFFMGDGGQDRVTAGAGNDQIFFDAAFAANDRIDGGADADILTLEGDYSSGVAFAANTVTNVETIQLAGNFTFAFTLHENTVAAGASCTITGGPSQVTCDASADTDAALIKLVGWTGADVLGGGAGTNELQGRGNADTLDGGGGSDTFIYTAVNESTGGVHDTVVGFDFKNDDLFDLWFAVTGTDDAVTNGALSAGTTFNDDLEAAIGAGDLAAEHALLFRPNSGTLDGEIFLIVDANATAGYQANADLVVHLEDLGHVKKFNAADFT